MATCLTSSLESSAAAVAYNDAHTKLGVLDRGGRITVWTREGSSRSWTMSSTWSCEKLLLTVLAWGADENGTVLVGGGADGAVYVWEERVSSAGWDLTAKLCESTFAVEHIAFAPLQLGAVFATAYADGFVRLFEATGPLGRQSWELQNELQAGQQGKACTSLQWRHHSVGIPPLLLVGTATSGAQIWMYRQQLLRWERTVSLGSMQVDYQNNPISSVAWAPTLGRPVELVAIAAGTRVLIWSLQGAADSMQTERVAVLEHTHPVWRVEWNMLGNWLAASTANSEVCLWRPDLLGEWLLVNKIVGKEASAMQSQ